MIFKTTILITLFQVLTRVTLAQIEFSVDSTKTLLCKKWEFKGILMAGQIMTNMKESVKYEFLSDGILKRTTSEGKLEKGSWKLDTDLKIVSFIIKKSEFYIKSLSEDEITVWPGSKEEQNSLGVALVLRLVDDG